MTKELMLAHKHLRFTLEELKILLVQGFKSAFLPYKAKRALLVRVNDRIEELTGSLPKGAILREGVQADDLPEALKPDAFEHMDTDRV
jgi:hypothetical protein